MIGGGVLLLLLILRGLDPQPLVSLRHELFDAWQRASPRPPAAEPVVIVDVDEASLARHGQWPWPRDLLAQLVGRILDAGPRAVGLDLLLPEPDRTSPPYLARHEATLEPALRHVLATLPDHDLVLAERIRGQPVVLGSALLAAGPPPVPPTGAPTPLVTMGADPSAFIPAYPARLANLPVLEEAAAGIGMITLLPERDGSARRLPLVVRAGDELRPLLGLEVLRQALGEPPLLLAANTAGVDAVRVGDRLVRTETSGAVWLHYAGTAARPVVPAAELLAATAPDPRLAGRMVLVGSSALGLGDLRPTPLDPAVPGVHIHAELIENIAEGRYPVRPNYALGLELALIAATGGLVLWLGPVLAPTLVLVSGGLVMAAVSLAAWGLFRGTGWLLDPSFATLAALSLWALVVGLQLLREARARARADRNLAILREQTRLAGEVQQAMLPQRFPELPGVQVAAAMEPALGVGGDFFDCFVLPDGRLALAVADVCGKGMPAALLMAVSRTMLRASLLATADSGTALALTNDQLTQDNESMQFVTAFVAILDPATGELACANAGHNLPWRLTADGRAMPLALENGPAMGVIEAMDYPVERTVLAPGEALLVFSDGLVEAFAASGEAYGEGRVAAALARAAGRSAEAMVGLIRADLRAFLGTEPLSDDVTCMALRRVPVPARPEPATAPPGQPEAAAAG